LRGLRQTHNVHSNVARLEMSALERRVRRLEAAVGEDGGGCDRCLGVMIVVRDALSGEFRSASWNGERSREEDLRERQTERECPQCGRKLDPEQAPVIEIGAARRRDLQDA
jgi:hypothetical protein